MNKSKARYDSKWKVTRILLSDYLLLKDLSQSSGVPMAEALHLALGRVWEFNTVSMPVKAMARSMPIQRVTMARSTPALTARPMPTRIGVMTPTSIAVNGSKSATIAIKPKGGLING